MIAAGLGARAGTGTAALAAAVRAALVAADVDRAEVTVLATLDRRAAEPAVLALAAESGRRLVAFTAAQLAAVVVPGASAIVAAAVGTPSVAEAAALLAAGPGAVLVLPKLIVDGVTVALARRTLP
ncbi:cobalamin biosynthesis protein [Actinoplanes palleronii]|uniref:Precorrin methylase n=1 Tax=Actinoplanes palleronii TaxID=113570 RepID=A0ABQ4BLJ8_9ACTN|nr:precorrin methylase [Actinoplanes palleronii]